MDVTKNGTSALLLGAAASLGIAALIGVISWTFGHVVEMSSNIAKYEAEQTATNAHQVQQDKWIDELNKKTETNQTETRNSLMQTNNLLNDIRARIDGKNH